LSTIVLINQDTRGDKGNRFQLPVGLGYIARSLELNNVDYEIADLNVDSTETLLKQMSQHRPSYVGFSMMSCKCERAYFFLAEVKRRFPTITVIVGGTHVSANRENVLKECTAIDIGVVGEGEETIVEIVRGVALPEIRGLVYRNNDEICTSEARPFIADLDSVPFPTYEGFNLRNYSEYMRLDSSRGCPYQCIFCGAPRILGRKWRARSADSMFRELIYWYERGYRSFIFNDSNFAVSRDRVETFCKLVIESRLNINFTVDGIRADHLTFELLALMKRAGCNRLTIGVESGDDKVLGNLKKGETRVQIESAIRYATQLGLVVDLFFVLGSPGEGVVEVEHSFDLAKKYDVSRVSFFVLFPLPGTELYEWTVSQGYYKDDYWQGRYPEDDFSGSDIANFPTDKLTIKQLNHCIRKARNVEKQIWLRGQWKSALHKYFGIEVSATKLNGLAWLGVHSGIGIPMLNGLVRFKERFW